MTPKQLTYFLRIAELGSFSRAASVLYVAQPALSRQIKQLEEELGVELFARSDAGVRLTEAGAVLAGRSRALLQQFDNVRSEVSAMSGSVSGDLRFGLPTSLFDLVTVPLLEGFRNEYPAVHLGVTEGISSTIHRMVVAGELDVGIVSAAESMAGLESTPLVTEALFFGYPLSMQVPLRQDGSVTLDQVLLHPLGLTQWPNAMRVLLEQAARDQQTEVRSLFDSNSSRLMIRATALGLGATVNTYSAFYEPHRAGLIRVAPIRGLSTTWVLIHARERGMPAAGRKLAELASRIARDRIEAGDWLGTQPA